MKHGRAVIPFGKYKGVRIRLLPDDYLSWLSGAPLMHAEKWKWLHDSLIAELKYRGLRYDLANTKDPVIVIDEKPKPTRKFHLD